MNIIQKLIQKYKTIFKTKHNYNIKNLYCSSISLLHTSAFTPVCDYFRKCHQPFAIFYKSKNIHGKQTYIHISTNTKLVKISDVENGELAIDNPIPFQKYFAHRFNTDWHNLKRMSIEDILILEDALNKNLKTEIEFTCS